jgi:hypothetical protein
MKHGKGWGIDEIPGRQAASAISQAENIAIALNALRS